MDKREANFTQLPTLHLKDLPSAEVYARRAFDIHVQSSGPVHTDTDNSAQRVSRLLQASSG